MIRAILTIIACNIIGNFIFFWAMTKLANKFTEEEKSKEPIFVGEDENGNGLYKFE